MSTRIMALCWPLQMHSTDKAVLISLADNANDSGYCWPSIATICERTCFGRTAVIEAIGRLEEGGYVTANRDNGRHTTYVISPQPVRQTDPSAKRTGPPDGGDPSASRTGPVRQTDTNRHLTVNEPSTKKERVRPAKRVPAEFDVTADLRAWAAEEVPRVDIDSETKRFRDHEWKQARTDWPAAWRNWMRRASESGNWRGSPPSRASPNEPTYVTKYGRAIAELTGKIKQPEVIDVEPAFTRIVGR